MKPISLMLCVSVTLSLAGCHRREEATTEAVSVDAAARDAHVANDASLNHAGGTNGSFAAAPAAAIANATDAAAAATAAQSAVEAQIHEAGVAPGDVGSIPAAATSTH